MVFQIKLFGDFANERYYFIRAFSGIKLKFQYKYYINYKFSLNKTLYIYKRLAKKSIIEKYLNKLKL